MTVSQSPHENHQWDQLPWRFALMLTWEDNIPRGSHRLLSWWPEYAGVCGLDPDHLGYFYAGNPSCLLLAFARHFHPTGLSSGPIGRVSSCPLLREHERSNEIFDKLGKLTYLEAFAMESWRTNCFQANTAHRVAVKPFEFSDGYKVKAGEAIEFNQHGVLWDESLYPEHTRFDPSRFLNKNKSLVDTRLDWPVWGVPRYIWLVVWPRSRVPINFC